ncbi:MAG: CDP-diacylglycerol--glycerol-3-phosphate 3-phosphatidyltransferase [Candidatus Kapaibacterium sp.]
MNLPNLLSLARIVIAPVFFFFFISGDPLFVMLSFYLFMLGATSDYLDGWFARKFNAATRWGRIFDPIADKVLTSFAFLAFVFMDIVPLWMVLIIILRDFGTTIMREFGEKFKVPMATSKSAKLKTFLQMAFISLILILVYITNSGFFKSYHLQITSFINSEAVYYTMLALTILTLWTLIEYILKNKRLIRTLLSKAA